MPHSAFTLGAMHFFLLLSLLHKSSWEGISKVMPSNLQLATRFPRLESGRGSRSATRRRTASTSSLSGSWRQASWEGPGHTPYAQESHRCEALHWLPSKGGSGAVQCPSSAWICAKSGRFAKVVAHVHIIVSYLDVLIECHLCFK